MLIGILSDTHDSVDSMAAGMKVLRAAGAEMFIHCGDVGSERILDQLAGTKSIFVWGNCDGDRVGLSQYAADIGVDCRGDFAELNVDGKRLAVTHGHEPLLVRRAMDPGKYDYFLYGHTHIPSDQKQNGLRIINPGALFRANPRTVAVLNPARDEMRRLIVVV